MASVGFGGTSVHFKKHGDPGAREDDNLLKVAPGNGVGVCFHQPSVVSVMHCKGPCRNKSAVIGGSVTAARQRS